VKSRNEYEFWIDIFPHDYVLRKRDIVKKDWAEVISFPHDYVLRKLEAAISDDLGILYKAFHTITFYGNIVRGKRVTAAVDGFPHDYVLRKP